QETGHVYVETDSPLSPELTLEPLTGKIKVSQIGMYDGTSDPDAHLGQYTSWMELHGATDALRCRMLSLTLGPKAQKWYYSLPAQSIRRWVQLRSAFRSHFIGAQVCLIPKESITNIVQKDDESLKEYVARFNERVQNMEPCHPETLLLSAISRLKPKSMFRWALCQNKPSTFQEFLVRAQNHVIAEESMSVPDFTFTAPGQKPTSEKKKKSFGNTHKKTSSTDPRWGDPNDPEVRAARKQYREDLKEGYRSIYSVGAAAIYEEIKGKGIIPDARPVKTPESQLDKGRYCDYHRSPGHNTDECLSLLSALMKLIGNPQVRKFTKAGDNKGKRRTQEIPDDDEGDEEGSTFKRLRAQGDKEIFVIGPADVGSPQDQLRKRGREADIQPRPTEPSEEVEIIDVGGLTCPKQLRIGACLPEPLRTKLIQFLQANADVFAWKHEDMKGIDPKVACHRLNIDKTVKPVIQKRRKLGPDRQQALEEDLSKLVDNKFVKETKYPTWVSNHVLVKKANGAWRLCIDFSDLNKACPKDSYPMPHIDYMVDATSGHELMSFMDAYYGYNQIPMDPEEAEHTSFYSARGLYCYTMMPFGLKNAGATYQWLVNKMFSRLIGQTMEVYVDDMLVKSVVANDHVTHLNEMFKILRDYSMVLNPKKCTFGVKSGKFLGYMVSQRGIEANPTKIRAILDLKSPTSVKGVQGLTGRFAALNRFISKSTDRCKPFFDAIKKGKKFEWTDECQKALENIKDTLSRTPVLQKPKPDETLYLYLGVSTSAVSAVLIREEETCQYPIYYVSKALHDAELRYPPMEKLAYALIIAARKLRPYFQEHSITVLTAHPLRQVLHRPDTSGRMIKWAVELGQFDIHYKPRTAIKGQVLSDFIAEFTPAIREWTDTRPWVMYVDGSSTATRAGGR
ncbi:Unknown protein, partial [Striga hermonthica]